MQDRHRGRSHDRGRWERDVALPLWPVGEQAVLRWHAQEGRLQEQPGQILTGLEPIGVTRLDATGRANGSEERRHADVAPHARRSMSFLGATARSPGPAMKRNFAALRISGCAALAAVLIAGSSGRADELSDVVPGLPGVTYGALLKQVMPHIQKNADGGW